MQAPFDLGLFEVDGRFAYKLYTRVEVKERVLCLEELLYLGVISTLCCMHFWCAIAY